MEKPLLRLILLLAIALVFPATHAAHSTNLVFDALSKEYNAAVGEMTAEFDFSVTNTATTNITIRSVRASCGCTTPRLPALPWDLAPGTNGLIHVTADLRGKAGAFQKTIFMDTSEGPRVLSIKVNLPSGGGVPGMDARTHNMQLAMKDRQTVFKSDCASCHKPSPDLRGEKLYVSACAVCHEAEHRATAVPDLQALKAPPTEAYWEAWIRYGKVATMMPAFALENDGPLSDEQISSLVGYLAKEFPNRKVKTAAVRLTPTPPPPGFAAPRTTIPALPTTLQGSAPPVPSPGS